MRPSPCICLPITNSLQHSFLAVAIDPALEEKQKAEAAMKELVANDPPTIGPDSAPVTIVEFTDFQCPYCQKLRTVLEQDVLPKEAEKVRIVFRNFPLETHTWAEAASMLAMCANLQDESSFWKLHDFIFDNQKLLTIDNLKTEVLKFMASNTTLEMKAFNKCADKDFALGMVRKDLMLGERFGVRSTPTAFVNGVKFEGIQGAAQLIALIESASAGVSLSNVNRTSHAQETADAPMCPVPGVSKTSVRRQLEIR
jgi:protein-disulfide isomerase